MRRKRTGAVDKGCPKAETLASRRGTYRLAKPALGVDPDVVDKLWSPVETALPELILRLTNRQLERGDEFLLMNYVAGAAVRHPCFFLAAASDYQAKHALPAPQGDEIQVMRVTALLNQLGQVATWRWRVLHSPEDASRFLISDLGWMYVGEAGWMSDGLFLPMGPRVAILGYLDEEGLPPRRRPFQQHLDLCQSWVEWFNAVAWANPLIELLIAHPDDRDRLVQLPDHRDLRVNAYGPYRRRWSNGLFD